MVEKLIDPMNDRNVKDLPLPPQRPLPHDKLFKLVEGKEVPDIQILKEHLSAEGKLTKQDTIQILATAQSYFKQEPNVLKLDEPVVVVGDLHGQYYDLVHMLEKAGDPFKTGYIFLGDYVDRGIFSIETTLLLFAFKINLPKSFNLLRGNHECRNMTDHFTFREEVLEKYDQEVYERYMETFDYMPLAAVIGGNYLCMHGGISPKMRSTHEIQKLDRFMEPPSDGLICDILWADPIEENLAGKVDFQENSDRQCSYKFGLEPAKDILDEMDLTLIIRAHQVQMQGYKMHYWEMPETLPTVITLFSAPNYCDVYKNKAAVIKLEGESFNIKNYEHVEHPYYLPGNLNLFQFTIPYLAEKVMDLLCTILSQVTDVEDQESIEDPEDLKKLIFANPNDPRIVKAKVNSIARYRRIYTNLRENSDLLLKIKIMNDGRIPRGLLLAGKPAIRDCFREYTLAKELDKENEKRPPMKGT